MTAISYTDFRARLAEVWESVVNDSLPHIITRRGKENLVVMAQSDYESMHETLYLMSREANRDALREAIQEAKTDKGRTIDWNNLEESLADVEPQ